MNARQHLERSLRYEMSGSPVIKALSDIVSLQYAKHVYDVLMSDRATSTDIQILRSLIEQAVITETIRKRRFGTHGKEYNMTWDEFEPFVKPYYDNTGQVHPAKVIFEDLQEINNGKMGR